jgi:hypothetical protein
MISCPYCDRAFGSDGSYRVHKHRFHQSLEYKQPIAVQDEVRQPIPEPAESEPDNTEPTPQLEETTQEQPQPEHRGRSVVGRGKSGDGGLAIIGGLGAIAVVIILALLGKKQ